MGRLADRPRAEAIISCPPAVAPRRSIVPPSYSSPAPARSRNLSASRIEASTLISARMAAAVYGLNDGLDLVSGHELDAETARQVPEGMIGRLLDDKALRKLQRTITPKKPAATSVRRRMAVRRVGKR
jgi:hypothetical protein